MGKTQEDSSGFTNSTKWSYALMTLIVFAFVVAVAAVIVWALFEMSPFAHHVDQFRDPVTGRKRGESPHLE